MKFPGGRAQGSLEFISDQLGLGKVEKSDKKTGATPKKSDVPGAAQMGGWRQIILIGALHSNLIY